VDFGIDGADFGLRIRSFLSRSQMGEQLGLEQVVVEGIEIVVACSQVCSVEVSVGGVIPNDWDNNTSCGDSSSVVFQIVDGGSNSGSSWNSSSSSQSCIIL